MGRKLETVSSEENKAKKKDEEFLDSLVYPFKVQLTNGQASFKDLFIPPPPLPDISHIVTPSASAPDTVGGQSTSPEKRTAARPDSRLLESPSRTSSRGSPSRSSGNSLKAKRSSEKIKAEKERLLNPKRDKFAQPGTG